MTPLRLGIPCSALCSFPLWWRVANHRALPGAWRGTSRSFAYEYVGDPAYRFDDNAASSRNRPHIPYLAPEAFKQHRMKAKKANATPAND